MSFNKEHCSPISLRKNSSELNNGGSPMNNSCLNRKLLEKIGGILNKNPNCDSIDCKCETGLLHDNICQNMSKISDCNSEQCWITVQEIVNNLKENEIDEFKEHFKPQMPDSWDSEPNKWLNTEDIDNVMLQYEKAFKDFEYLGAHPIDAEKCSVSQEVCKINLKDLKKKGKEKIGIIFNTDYSTGPGEHWVSFYVDLIGRNRKKKPGIYYFDSVADKPQKEIFHLANRLKKQGKRIGIDLDFFYNDIQHQKKDTECGIYSLYFIISMMNNINFKDFVKKIKNDEFMEKYRKIFYLDK